MPKRLAISKAIEEVPTPEAPPINIIKGSAISGSSSLKSSTISSTNSSIVIKLKFLSFNLASIQEAKA